jgi:hypothetical protein
MSCCRRLLCLLFTIALTTAARAAEPEWLKLQAPSFGVISQLGEDATRRWAVEFDQFISATETLYAVEGLALPPLTIVLFRQSKDFAPYRLQTESGQAQVAGFFGRMGDWSVIGLSGGGRDTTTRPLIYHEAVHWFASANPTELPLWFSEGFAEVLSTFRVVDGKGRWGEAIESNVNYLANYGLLPIEDVLRASQDEALHGHGMNKYYPQSWAFVHYLMFGNQGVQRPKLAELLRQQRETDLDTAFNAAFGKSYDDFTAELRRYLTNGRYSYAVVELRDRSEEMVVEPASEANVEFALGRLAVTSNNLELAHAHADRVIALAPGSPAGYELKAYAARETDDQTALAAARDRAIELGSRDSWVYASKADRLVYGNEGALDDLMLPGTAREAADLYQRALELRPGNPAAVPGFVLALLNLDAVTDTDNMTLNANRIMLPSNGLLLVGQAAVEKRRGNVREAVQLLGRAAAEPFTLPQGFRQPIAGLRDNWQGQWYSEQLSTFMQEGRFEEYRQFVDEQLADETSSRRIRTYLENARDNLPEIERLYAASGAANRAESVAMLNAIIDDPNVSEPTKRIARRMLGIRPGSGAETAVIEN